MLEELADRKGFEVPYAPRFVEALHAAFGTGFTLRVARHSGRDVAVLLDLRAGDTATSFMGAATPEGRKVRASYLLTWDALVHHRVAGVRTYDMGSIGRDRSTGPSAFKVRSGGEVVEFPGTFLVGTGLRAQAVKTLLRLKAKGH
jgi:lipid II:glycine glycyltransferase (peptidoglycan interpeptide bridge formation enzyme)